MKTIGGLAALALMTSTALWIMHAAPITIKLTFPAKSMRPQTVAFRDDFENRYRKPRIPLPLFTMMFRAGINPEDPKDQAAIGKTADGKARVAVFSADGNSISSDGNGKNAVLFGALLSNKVRDIRVDCPAHLAARIDANYKQDGSVQSLKFTFADPIPFHINPADFPGAPKDVYLTSILLSDSLLQYGAQDAGANPGRVFTVTLDLTK